jgi:hypothetical protein
MKTKHQSVQIASNMLWKRTSSPGCHGVILPYALIGTTVDQPEYQVLQSAPNSVLTASLAEPLGSCVVTIPTKSRYTNIAANSLCGITRTTKLKRI